MNFELLKAGFPPAIIAVEQRLEYYRALDTAHTKNEYALFFNLIAQVAAQSFEPYWRTLGITERK